MLPSLSAELLTFTMIVIDASNGVIINVTKSSVLLYKSPGRVTGTNLQVLSAKPWTCTLGSGSTPERLNLGGQVHIPLREGLGDTTVT